LYNLTAREIYFRYPGRDDWALEDVDCVWHKGETILLVGPAGAGKSTLGRVFKGLLKPERGRIVLQSETLVKIAKSEELINLVSWADSQPERQIFAETVQDEIAFGPIQRGLPADEVERLVRRAFEWAGLDFDKFSELDPLSLSGGEKRRIALASAVAAPTDFFILDEPGAGLDDESIARTRNTIWKLGEGAAGVLVISHNPADFFDLADRVWLMEKGKVKVEQAARKSDLALIEAWLQNPAMEGLPESAR